MKDLVAYVNMPINEETLTTPLMRAVTIMDKESSCIVELLLKEGADVNAKTISLNTALHIACQYNKLEIVKLLVEKGADSTLKN